MKKCRTKLTEWWICDANIFKYSVAHINFQHPLQSFFAWISVPTFQNALQKSFIFIFSQNRSTKSNLGMWKGYCNEAWLYMQPPQLEQCQEIAFIPLQTRLSNSISISPFSHNIDSVAKIEVWHCVNYWCAKVLSFENTITVKFPILCTP